MSRGPGERRGASTSLPRSRCRIGIGCGICRGGLCGQDRRDDEARCDSIRQQAEVLGKSGEKLLADADSVRGNANADESAKSGADQLRSDGFLKGRTAAYLMIGNKSCFSPSDVAYAKTLLDALDKLP